MRLRAIAAALVLLLVDLSTVAASYVAAFMLRSLAASGLLGHPAGYELGAIADRWYLLLVYAAAFAYEGLYTRRFVDWEETRRCFRGVSIAGAVVIAVVFGLRFLELSRAVLALASVLALVAIPMARIAVRRGLLRSGLLVRPLVMVGGGDAAEAFRQELLRHPGFGYSDPVHVERAGPAETVVALLERAQAQAPGATLTVFSDSFTSEEAGIMLRHAERRFGDIMVVPTGTPLRLQAAAVEQFGSTLVLKYQYNLLRPVNRWLKRGIELGVCGLAVVLLAPLLMVLALLVRISSAGTALFRQERIGRLRRVFRCLKLRTMYADAEARLQEVVESSEAARREWQTYARIPPDPRVTPLGRVLRRWSLDELPQLLNVLRGDMALVGPRPYLPSEQGRIGAALDTIVRVRPGLTGLWQVSGRSNVPFEERVLLDEYYIRNWSLWLDFSIVLRTLWVVLSGSGSY